MSLIVKVVTKGQKECRHRHGKRVLGIGGEGVGRKNKKNKLMSGLNEVEKHVLNDDTVNGNTDDMSFIAVKINDIECKMLEGMLALVGDNVILIKTLNVDGQSTAVDHFPCLSDTFGTPNTSTKVATTGSSNTPSTNPSKKVANFHTLIAPNGNGPDEVVSLESKVKERFENSVYGFFLGKRVTYPVVENCVKNSWSRFGLVRTMMNSKGIFFFRFSSNTGMESMLENGPWLMHKVPLVLCKWSSLVNVAKEELMSVLVRVKLHDVPITKFANDGLSAISTKLANKEKLMLLSNISVATFKQLMLFDYKFVTLGLEYMVNAAIMIMLLMLLGKDVTKFSSQGEVLILLIGWKPLSPLQLDVEEVMSE
uniref:DUF4283 domain-containing protein n=1 Tax=Tanacetum cinerariifolium TaxID=118510 RepID=A0A6L2NRF4_TANCI|nr:hypothetical protein [Tanacetum cinerariifolium]